MDLITNEAEEIIDHHEMILLLRNYIEEILKYYRPVMNGEIYLSGQNVCELLHISKRTLQQYRNDKILPFIQIGEKIIFKQSNILTALEQNYVTNKAGY
jgi:excisionase family DNA binding protein